MLAECIGMRDRGHEVWLATPGAGMLSRRAVEAGLDVVPFTFDRLRLPFRAHRLASLVRRVAADVVNSHSSADSWTAALARRTGWGGAALVRSRHISAMVRPGPLHRLLYGSADYLITTGESVRQGLAASGLVPSDRSMSIPTGVDVTLYAPRPEYRAAARRSLDLDETAPVVGVVAYLRADKGHTVLLQAMTAVLESQPAAVLVVVGDGPRRADLEAQAARLDVASHVRFAGLREDVPFVLSALDIFCLPSVRNEGVPQSILQASAASLPVVSTRVGGIPEAVASEVTGQLVPPGDPGSLARAILGLLADPERRRSFGEAGRRRVSDAVSVKAMLDRTEAAYAAALGSVTRSVAVPKRSRRAP